MAETIDAMWATQLLRDCPMGVAVFDADGTMVWANAALAELTGHEVAKLIGMRREGALDVQFEPLFDHAPFVSWTGAGDPAQRWFECHYQRVDMPGRASVEACFLVDTTEKKALEAQLSRLTMTDAATGVLNRRGLLRDLEPMVSRSRRYGNMLTIVLMRLENAAELAAAGFNGEVDEVMLCVSRLLREEMRWADVIGRFAEDTFMLILPETGQEAAMQLADKIRGRLTEIACADPAAGELHAQTAFGPAQWRRGDDTRLLLQRANDALAGKTEGPDREAVNG